MQSWNWNDQTQQAHAAAAASYAASQVANQSYSNVPAMQSVAQAQMAYQQYYGAAMPGAPTPELTQQQLEAQQWQWNTWHQSFQQWQKEYGGQYQAAMNPLAAQGMIPPMGMTQPMVPDMARPPPVPPPEKPPPPPPDDQPESFPGQKRRPEETLDPSKKPRIDEFQNARSGNKDHQRGGRWGPSAGAQVEVKADTDQAMDELSDQEKAFDLQFLQWEKQFSEWKAANINHPDKNQYREYEVKWMGWREKLLQRRVDMKQKREKAALTKTAVPAPLPVSVPTPQASRPPNQAGKHASMSSGDNWGNRPGAAGNLPNQNLPGPQMPPSIVPGFQNRGSPNPQLPAAATAPAPRSLLDIPLGFMAEKANAFLRGGQRGPLLPGSEPLGPGTQPASATPQGNFAAVRNQGTIGPQQPRNVPGNAGTEQKNAGARNQASRPGQQKLDGSNVLNFPKAIQLSQNTCQAIKGSQQSGGETAASQPEASVASKQAEAAAAKPIVPAPVLVDLEGDEKKPVNYDFLKKTNNGIPGLDFAETDAAPDTPNSNSQNDSLKFGQDSSTSQDIANSFGPKIHTSQGQGFQFPKAPPPPPPAAQVEVSQEQGGNSQDANQGLAVNFEGTASFGSFAAAAVPKPAAVDDSRFYMDDFDSMPATARNEAGNEFRGPQQFSFGPQDQNPQFRGVNPDQTPGAPNQVGMLGNSGQTRAFPPNSQQISFGPKGQQNALGPNSQLNAFGQNNQQNAFGPNNMANSFGPGGQQNVFGQNNQPNAFGAKSQQNAFGANSQQNSLGPSNQPNAFGFSNQPNNFGQHSQPNSFGQGNQPNSFAQGNQPNSFGQGNQPNSFGQGNQPNSFGQGNQPNSFGQGNQHNSFGQGNQPNSFGQGNQPNSFGQGNQPNSFGQGNQPNSFGQGNQPNSFGQGNQPNTFGSKSQQPNNFGPNNQPNTFGPNRPAPFGVKNQLGPNNETQPNHPSNFGPNRSMPGMNQSFGPNQNKPLGFGRGQAPPLGGLQASQRMPGRIGGPEKSWNQAPQDRDSAKMEGNDYPNEEDEEFGPEDYDEEWVRLNSDEPDEQPANDEGGFVDDGPNAGPRNAFGGRGRGGMQGMRDQGRPGFPQGPGPGFRPLGGRGSFSQGDREGFATGDGDFPQGGRDGFHQGGRDGLPPGSRDGMLQREGLGPNSFQQQGPNNGPKSARGGLGGFARGPHSFPQGGAEHGLRDSYPADRDDFADSFVRYEYGDTREARDYGPRGFAGPYDRWNDQEDFYRNKMIAGRDEEERRLSRQWEESTFELEPATIVEYGHKPAGPTIEPAAVPAVAKFVPPVQTFDYGHGGAAATPSRDPLHFTPVSAHFAPVSTHLTPGPAARHRPSPPPHGDAYHREDHRDFGQRDRDRDRERERDRERDYHSGRWERDRPPRRNDDEDRYRSSRDDRDRPIRRPDMEWDRERDLRGRDVRRDDSARGRALPPPPPSFSEAGRREGPSAKRDAKPSALPPVNIDDLVSQPGRKSRPPKIVIILRGPPGSGKSFAAKLIKEKETENGGSAPRILCLDDYFITETEVEKTDPETGRKRKVKEIGYEYEVGMEKHYRSSLLKTFRKTVTENYFSFIIVDCVNQEVKHFEEMWSHAKQKGFQVYICEMDADVSSCFKRNVHHRTEAEIADIVKGWEDTPATYLKLDLRSLLQSAAITDVEMEDAPDEDEAAAAGDEKEKTGAKEDEDTETISKWEIMEQPTGDKLDRMDGLKRRKGDEPRTLEDWLATDEDYANRESLPGKKRVRWADLEEKRSQAKMRAIGFVVGQTDWSRMTDPTCGESALTQTKYI